MRSTVLLYINGKRHLIKGDAATQTLSEYLRSTCRLTGTKIVCAEGDCGACTVLHGTLPPQNRAASKLSFNAINSCIKPLYLLDCSHIITIEGVEKNGELHPIQQAMVDSHGSQCGFCTPGFVMALAGFFETKRIATEKRIKNCLTGNLCRCTGYQGIIKAACQLTDKKFDSLAERYHSAAIVEDIRQHRSEALLIEGSESIIHAPTSLQEACAIKRQHSTIVASATDLGVCINKQGMNPNHVISLQLIDELYRLEEKNHELYVGARVTLTELEKYIEEKIPVFADFLKIFASPQIKNTGTLVGNVANASPIADTPPFLLVADAVIEMASSSGTRSVKINEFYKAYKKIDLNTDEIITAIRIPLPPKTDILKCYKVSQRKDLDISCVNAAFRLTLAKNNLIEKIHIAYGGVAPTSCRLKNIETFMQGKAFTPETIEQAALMLTNEISPISDVRGSAAFRLQLSQNLLRKFYAEVSSAGVNS